MKRALFLTALLILGLTSASAEGVFGVLPEQYGRLLQLMKAKGLFAAYSHSCKVEADGTGYRCEDLLDRVHVVYYAENETTQINSVTVGALPEDSEKASALAATATLSLSARFNSLSADSPAAKKLFQALQSDVRSRMERVFVRGGSDITMTKDAILVIMVNANKDMTLVRVAPLSKK